LASQILFHIDQSYDDIEGKLVCDLGVGTGMLSIGCAILDADFVVGVDIDKDALAECQENIQNFELGHKIDLINCDCERIILNNALRGKFDTVITNPPFGK
jgi:predicted RNA methylase